MEQEVGEVEGEEQGEGKVEVEETNFVAFIGEAMKT